MTDEIPEAIRNLEPHRMTAQPIIPGRWPSWVYHAARLGYDPEDVVRQYNESIEKRPRSQ